MARKKKKDDKGRYPYAGQLARFENALNGNLSSEAYGNLREQVDVIRQASAVHHDHPQTLAHVQRLLLRMDSSNSPQSQASPSSIPANYMSALETYLNTVTKSLSTIRDLDPTSNGYLETLRGGKEALLTQQRTVAPALDYDAPSTPDGKTYESLRLQVRKRTTELETILREKTQQAEQRAAQRSRYDVQTPAPASPKQAAPPTLPSQPKEISYLLQVQSGGKNVVLTFDRKTLPNSLEALEDYLRGGSVPQKAESVMNRFRTQLEEGGTILYGNQRNPRGDVESLFTYYSRTGDLEARTLTVIATSARPLGYNGR